MIKTSLNTNLGVALSNMEGGGQYRRVDFIKIVEKQLQGYKEFTNQPSGSLTQAATEACKEICTEFVGHNNQLVDKFDKVTGMTYVQTNKETGQKFQVIRSAGTHKRYHQLFGLDAWKCS
jgi:hypothetical protein